MRHLRWLPAIVVTIALAYLPVEYFARHWQDSAFYAGTMGNWFATLMGIVLGVPIALWLAQWQQVHQNQAIKLQQGQEQRDRQAAMLRLVHEELTHNRDQAQQGIRLQAQNRVPIGFLGLKHELWQALSQGGELH